MVKSKTISPELIADISFYSCALPIFAFLIFKRNWSDRLKWVCFFIILISVLADLVNSYLANKHLHNLWVINIYFLLDSLLVLFFFYQNFMNDKLYKLIIVILLTLLFTSWLYNYFGTHLMQLDSRSNGIETLSIIILSILFFYEQLSNPKSLFVYSTPVFWIVAGLLIYKAGTFFLFLYFNTLEASQKEAFRNYYIINSAFLMLRNLLFTVAFFTQDATIKKRNNLRPVL